MAKEYHIVWNKSKTEGFITDDLDDAELVVQGHEAVEKAMERGMAIPTAGASFAECYGYEPEDAKSLTLQTVALGKRTELERRADDEAESARMRPDALDPEVR